MVMALAGKSYITIHGYITQVWRGIIEHRDMMVKAAGYDDAEKALEDGLVIDTGTVGTVDLIHVAEWRQYRQVVPQRAVNRIEEEEADNDI